MRKKDRESGDFSQILAIVAKSQVVRLGRFAEDYPYGTRLPGTSRRGIP